MSNVQKIFYDLLSENRRDLTEHRGGTGEAQVG